MRGGREQRAPVRHALRPGRSVLARFDVHRELRRRVRRAPWLASHTAAHDGVDDPTFVIAAWHDPACSSQYLTRSSARYWMHDHFVATLRARRRRSDPRGARQGLPTQRDRRRDRPRIGNVPTEIPGGNHAACRAVNTHRPSRSALVAIDGATLAASVVDETGAEVDSFVIAK